MLGRAEPGVNPPPHLSLQDGDTPLHNAAGNARDDVIDLLLRSGAVITESLVRGLQTKLTSSPAQDTV